MELRYSNSSILSSDMQKFALKSFALVVFACALLTARQVWRIYRARIPMDLAFTLSPAQKYLFIGSSQIGCDIIESEPYSNRVLWVSTSGPQFTCMKLIELERRNQLKYVEVCVVPLTINNINHNAISILQLSLARQLPLCWRYVDLLPLSFSQMISGVMDNCAIGFSLSEQPPLNRPSVSTRSEQWILDFPDREKVRDTIFNEQMYITGIGLAKNWYASTIDAYLRMSNICAKNNIRFVVIAPPLPSFCRALIPKEGWKLYKKIAGELVDNGIEFRDFRNDMPDRCFCDYWHLIESGAVDFTRMCYQKIGLK